jgi:hypothetical protein
MIMGAVPVGGVRTNPPTQPDRPPVSSSNGPPTCDQPWSRLPAQASAKEDASTKPQGVRAAHRSARTAPARGSMPGPRQWPTRPPRSAPPPSPPRHQSRPATTRKGAPCGRAVCAYRAVLPLPMGQAAHSRAVDQFELLGESSSRPQHRRRPPSRLRLAQDPTPQLRRHHHRRQAQRWEPIQDLGSQRRDPQMAKSCLSHPTGQV